MSGNECILLFHTNLKWIEPMRHFDTDSLETLVTIVDRGGFTAAGDALGKTQAAVSVIVAKLEGRLGKRLRNARAAASPRPSPARRCSAMPAACWRSRTRRWRRSWARGRGGCASPSRTIFWISWSRR